MPGPNPMAERPQIDTAFLKTIVSRPNIKVGDYSYYHDSRGPERFETQQVIYHHDFLGDQLIIGKFCAIAEGVRFIMNGANHLMDGFSTYPFPIFGNGWEDGFDPAAYVDASRGDMVIGNDVWIGNGATILPGVSIGSGAIIGAGAVVGSDVPDYAIVAGNPAKLVRMRFDENTVTRLMTAAWWDWPVETISENIAAITGGNLEALERAAPI